LVAALIMALLVAIGIGVYSTGRMMMGERPIDAARFHNAQIGDSVDLAIVVNGATAAASFPGTLLDPTGQGSYRRTDQTVEVQWGPDTSVVMGRREEIGPGSVLQVRGRVLQSQAVAARQLVVLSGFVTVH
jgi:hypothetical protein